VSNCVPSKEMVERTEAMLRFARENKDMEEEDEKRLVK